MGVGKEDAAGRKAIHVGRLGLRMASQTADPVVQIIDGDEKNIGLWKVCGSQGRSGAGEHAQEESDAQETADGVIHRAGSLAARRGGRRRSFVYDEDWRQVRFSCDAIPSFWPGAGTGRMPDVKTSAVILRSSPWTCDEGLPTGTIGRFFGLAFGW